MFEGFKEPVQVVILKSIGGLPEPNYGLERAFSYLPGNQVDLHPKLARLWCEAGIARPASEVSDSELFDLKLISNKY